MNVLSHSQLRDQLINLRIKTFLQQKAEKGQPANSREIAAAIDVRRFIVVLKLANMQAANEIAFVGHLEMPDGVAVPLYTAMKR